MLKTTGRAIVLCLMLMHTSFLMAEVHTAHAIAMHGTPLYPKSFEHFNYANPSAKKGGSLKLASQGTFDSLNGFIAKGNATSESGMIYDSLTVASADEAFTQYGLIAKTITWPEDRTWVEYTLRPEATFHDGTPVTANDVKFTFETLMEEGHPGYKIRFGAVSNIEVKNKHQIRFNLENGENRELILLIGQLPVLPKHYWKDREFNKSTLEPPLGSGPYRITSVSPGKTIILERVKDYWAKDLNVNKGRFNFDSIRFDYYRDSTVLLEALKAGEYDVRLENVSKLWATGYSGDAIDKGWLVKERIEHSNPTGMQAFVMNLRNPLFQDIRVRKALAYAFDFEWTNEKLFYGAYKRNNSYFSNSELAAKGLPSEQELKYLEPLRDSLPSSVFNEPFKQQVTKGDGNNRQQLRKAKKLLDDAGWKVNNNILENADGKQFRFEILMFQPTFERILNPYIKSLEKLGVKVEIRKVELSQYINKRRSFDFDMMVNSFSQSLSPGLEQIQYWHSSTADVEASGNFIGIRNPAIDKLVKHVIQARTRDELIHATRALDRALLHNWYVIPQWHIDAHRVAYWDKFSRPETTPKYDGDFTQNLFTWWYDEKKASRIGM